MSIFVDIQKAHSIKNVPSHSLLIDWTEMALADYKEDVVLSVRICDEHEGKELNSKFRKKSKASNVLSFPFENPIGVPKEAVANYLGDIVICAPIVEKEAIEQSKNNIAHWAHLGGAIAGYFIIQFWRKNILQWLFRFRRIKLSDC